MLKGDKASRRKTIRPRLRVMRGTEIALGPGKVELLELLQRTGSIQKAAQRMGMSYMRAWTLIKTMQRCFKEPLVRAVRGGSARGGAGLTVTGKRVLALYRQMEGQSLMATRSCWRRLKTILRD